MNTLVRKSVVVVIWMTALCVPTFAQRFVKVFDSIPSMLAANPNDVHTNAYVAGRLTANDGGGAIYTWNSSSVASTQANLSILKANSFPSGRWYRDNGFVLTTLTTNRVAGIGSDGILTNTIVTIDTIESLALTGTNTWLVPEMFGATGNGSTDDTTAWQNTINASHFLGRPILVPAHTYSVNSLTGFANMFILGTPGKSILKQRTAANYVMSFNPGNGGTTNVSGNLTNITLNGITFQGRSVENGLDEHWHLLNLNAVSDVLINGCRFLSPQGDGIYLGSGNIASIERHNRNVSVLNCIFDGINKSGRNGIGIIDVDGFLVSGCYFTRLTHSTEPGAIDFEPDPTDTFHIIKNAVITNNRFYDMGGNVGVINILIQANFNIRPFNFTISNNSFDLCPTPAFVATQNAITNTTSTFPYQITFSGNTVTNTIRPFTITGIKGIDIIDNWFLNNGNPGLIGFNSGVYQVCIDVTLANNYFRDIGISVFSATNLWIRNNQFLDCAGAAIDFSSGSSSYVSLLHNQVSSHSGVTTVAFNIGGSFTLDPYNNFKLGNQIHDGIPQGGFTGYFSTDHIIDRDVVSVTNGFFVVHNTSINPTNGQGIEITYNDVLGRGVIQPYDHDGAGQKKLGLFGSDVFIGSDSTINFNAQMYGPQMLLTNFLSVGQAGDTPLIDLTSANTTYTDHISVDNAGRLTVTNNAVRVFSIAAASAYGGTGTNYLSDNGIFHAVDTLTDGTDFMQVTGNKVYFSSGLDLGSDSSPFGPVDDLQMAGVFNLFGSGAGTVNYEKLLIDHQGASGVIIDSTAGGSGTPRDFLFRIGGQSKLKITTGSLIPANSTDYNIGAPTSANSFWNDIFSKGVYYTYGFGEGTSDTEYGSFFHDGSSAVVMDSRATGAGVARDFYWKSNGVTIDRTALASGYTGAGTKVKTDNGTYQALVFPPGGTAGTMINTSVTSVGQIPYATDTTKTNWSPSGALTVDASTNATVNGQLIFGPGATNVLYRGTNNLVYTNNASSTSGFIVKTGTGEADVQVTTGGNAFLSNPGSGTVGLSPSSGNSVEIVGTRFFPNPTATLTLGSTGNLWQDLFLNRNIVWNGSTNTVFDFAGTGSPEGVKTANPGSTFRRFDGGASTVLYVKESGAGNTGWVAYGAGGTTYSAGAGIGLSGTTFSWAPETRVNNVTLWDGSQASRTITYDVSGTDSIWTISSGIVDLTTGTLKYAGNIVATVASKLSAFAATTSAELFGVISDETGSGSGTPLLVFNQNPTIQGATMTGNLLFSADNTYDIGASVATRPRRGYFSGTVTASGGFNSESSSLSWGSIATPVSSVNSFTDGVIRIANGAGTDFTRLLFGGSTASFPALKRSGTGLLVRLADDSGDGALTAGSLQLGSDTASATTVILKGGNGSGTDKAGDTVAAEGGQSTGTGIRGGLLGKLAAVSTASSSSLNSYNTFAIGGTLKVDTTTTGNIGAGEDTLITYTIPAGILGVNGDSIEFDCGGTFASTINSKTLKGYYGSTVFLNTSSLVLNNLPWRGHGRIIRTGATTQKISVEFTVGGTLLSAVNGTICNYTTAAETLTGTVVFKWTGSDDGGVPADNAVVQEFMHLKFQQNN